MMAFALIFSALVQFFVVLPKMIICTLLLPLDLLSRILAAIIPQNKYLVYGSVEIHFRIYFPKINIRGK